MDDRHTQTEGPDDIKKKREKNTSKSARSCQREYTQHLPIICRCVVCCRIFYACKCANWHPNNHHLVNVVIHKSWPSFNFLPFSFSSFILSFYFLFLLLIRSIFIATVFCFIYKAHYNMEYMLLHPCPPHKWLYVSQMWTNKADLICSCMQWWRSGDAEKWVSSLSLSSASLTANREQKKKTEMPGI